VTSSQLGAILVGRGRRNEALPLLEEAYAPLLELKGAEAPEIRFAERALGRARDPEGDDRRGSVRDPRRTTVEEPLLGRGVRRLAFAARNRGGDDEGCKVHDYPGVRSHQGNRSGLWLRTP